MPSPALADFSCNEFAVLDYVDAIIQRYSRVSVREAGQYVISKYCPNAMFTCDEHIEWGTKFATKIIVNIFYNNKQKLTADSVRKEAVKTFKKTTKRKVTYYIDSKGLTLFSYYIFIFSSRGFLVYYILFGCIHPPHVFSPLLEYKSEKHYNLYPPHTHTYIPIPGLKL